MPSIFSRLVFRYRQQIEQANLDPDAMLASAWAVVPLPPTNKKLTIDGKEIMALSEKNLDTKEERNFDEPYYHDAITIEPSEYELE